MLQFAVLYQLSLFLLVSTLSEIHFVLTTVSVAQHPQWVKMMRVKQNANVTVWVG